MAQRRFRSAGRNESKDKVMLMGGGLTMTPQQPQTWGTKKNHALGIPTVCWWRRLPANGVPVVEVKREHRGTALCALAFVWFLTLGCASAASATIATRVV
jgi:hypothetical protein